MHIQMLMVIVALAAGPGPDDPAARVNPLIGTGAANHAFPGAAYPFGMVQLSPDTGGDHGLFLLSDWKWCAGYHYDDPTIMGFSHLHRSGMGVGDWGDILVMPTAGPLRTKPGDEDRPESGYRSRFRHETEIAEPGYYAVTLDDYDLRAELTVAERVGVHRYTFPAADPAHIIIDLGHGLGDAPLLSRIRIIGDDTIVGTRTSTGLIPFQKVHFCARFGRPFESFGTWNGPVRKPGNRFEAGSRIGAFVTYRTDAGDEVVVKVGLSFTNEAQACANLDAEVPDFDFERVRRETGETWSRELGKIAVLPGPGFQEDEIRERMAVFYTALYHSLLFPAVFSDHDGTYSLNGNVPGCNGHIEGDYYSDYSIWDTFRAQMPLLVLLEPGRMNAMVRTLLAEYEDSGWLPAPNHFGNYHSEGMIGDPAACVIYDAYAKGLRGFDAELAYEAMKKNAVRRGWNVIPMLEAGTGRWDGRAYNRRGYVPAGGALPPNHPLFIAPYAYNQGVSRTLEYAYADFCVAGMARATGHSEDYELFRARADNYQNVFDPATGFMRGKTRAGKWSDPDGYDPSAYYAYYTEGNGWQWTWSVFHDVDGLITLLGGAVPFNRKLDEFFAAGPKVEAYDLFAVHIGEMIGQYAHANEPSHHIVYLYDYSGEPWKTQELARRVMDEFYRDAPAGLAGNDDMGQMSAWYVFSALGFYPIAPGVYLIGSPVFERAEMTLADGGKLVVEAENASAANKYIQEANLNGAPLGRPWLAHSEIASGAVIRFRMGPVPNRAWGARPEAAPPSGDRIYGLGAAAEPGP